MDWHAKHFTQEAVFSAAPASVLAAARAVMAAALERVDDTADGFVAHGYSAGHAVQVTFRFEPASSGTKVAVELLVARAAWRGFMLFDVGGYYDSRLRRWLAGIAQRLGQPLLSLRPPVARQGCLAGCAVYIVLGTGLAILALPLDRFVLLPPSSPLPGPAMFMASMIGLFAGGVVFFYARYPEASIWSAARGRLSGLSTKKKP